MAFEFDANKYTRAPGTLTSETFGQVHDDCMRYLKAPRMGFSDAEGFRSLLVGNVGTLRAMLATPSFPLVLEVVEGLGQIKRSASNSELVDALPPIFGYVLQHLGRYAAQKPDEYLQAAEKIAQRFASSSDPTLLRISTEIYFDNFNRIIGSPATTEDAARKIVKQLIGTANDTQIALLTKDAIDPTSVLKRKLPNSVDSILNLQLLGPNTAERPSRMRAILDVISSDRGDMLLNAWDDSEGIKKDRNKASESVYFDNFAVICQLENRRPGIVRLLIESYGILTFGRYPLDMLVDQFDSHGLKDKENGLLMVARHDYNGFASHVKDETAHAYIQAKELEMSLKVIEGEDVAEVRKYRRGSVESNGQASFGIIIAHGDTRFIKFGSGEDSESELGIRHENLDAEAEDFEDIQKSLKPGSSLLLISCSTGSQGGIAQAMSARMPNIDIHAPDQEASLKEKGIEIKREGGRVRAEVVFTHSEGNFNTIDDTIYALSSTTRGIFNLRTGDINVYSIPTRVYRAGILVRDYVG